MADVVRYEPKPTCEKPMYMSKNGRYVHYNDWKKERTEVNALRLELTRLYLMLEGVTDVRITDGGTTVILSLDNGEGESPRGICNKGTKAVDG